MDEGRWDAERNMRFRHGGVSMRDSGCLSPLDVLVITGGQTQAWLIPHNEH